MRYSREEHCRFVQWLDRTAERNPVLWLPCIILLSVILGFSGLISDIKTVAARSDRESVPIRYGEVFIRKKPFALRTVAVSLTILMFIGLIPIGSLNVYAAQASCWDVGYSWKNVSDFSVDSSEKYSGAYSIKIENKDYNDSFVERSFSVLPNTRYKLSAYVKYSGYSLNPSDYGKESGASIGISASYNYSKFVTSDTWTKLEFPFNSGDSTEITLCLRNGTYGGTCKGTAWFSDIKLEKDISRPTNEWNILAVVFKNVNAPVIVDGVSSVYNQSLDDADVQYLSGVLNNLYTTFDSISGGLMKVKNIDVVASDEVLTSVAPSDSYLYCLDPYDPQVSRILDQYLKSREYDQIIAISPIRDISRGWSGLGGTKYGNIHFCQINYKTRDPYPGNFDFFPDAIFVHEMLHCMESASKAISPGKTAGLHDNSLYGFNDGSDEWRAWYTAYMRAELAGGKGIDPSVYMVYNDSQYTLVSDDMSVSRRIGVVAHDHLFGSDWKIDKQAHWHECSCGERSDMSAHTEDSGDILVQPTAESSGLKAYYCTVCGSIMRTELIPPTEEVHSHYFSSKWSSDSISHWHECSCGEKSNISVHAEDKGVITIQPTATATGLKVYSCTVCSYVIRTEIIPALEEVHTHSFGLKWSSDRRSHWHECSCGEKSDISAHTEDKGVVTKQPTATETGLKVYSCTVCGYEMRTENIPPVKENHTHSFSSLWLADRYSHRHECQCGEKSDISAHTEDSGVVTVRPTAVSAGLVTYSCKVCGYVTRTMTIPPIGSSIDTYPTPSHPETPAVTTAPAEEEKLVEQPISEDIKIAMKCKLNGLSDGTARLITKKKFFDHSAIVSVTQTEASKVAASNAVANLNGGSEHNISYPFDITIYNANTNEIMSMSDNGYITLEIPVPKSLTDYADEISVYNIADGVPKLLKSSITVSDGSVKVHFTASKLSPFMFNVHTAFSVEDVAPGAGTTANEVPIDSGIPVTNGVTIPNAILPKNLKFSIKKRKYRILRKRILSDLVFVY